MEVKTKTSLESLPPVSPKTTGRPETSTNRSSNGSNVQSHHQGYMANTDSVYDSFARDHHLGKSSADNVNEIRGRLNSVGGLFPPQNRQESLSVRPSTTDGNYKPKPSHVFWEYLGVPPNSLRIPITIEVPQPSPRVPANTPRQEGKDNNEDSTPAGGPGTGASLKSEKLNHGGRKCVPRKSPIPPQPLVRFNSSGDFKAVVNDLYGKKEKKPITSSSKWMNIRRLANVKAKSVFQKSYTAPEITLRQREEKALKLKAAASRGWDVIRRYINRQQFLKSTSGAFLNWSFLKQHLSSMSDLENTRKDLYERYGVIPTIQSDGTFRSVNVMRPRRTQLNIVAFKRIKPKNVRAIPRIPAFRETVLK